MDSSTLTCQFCEQQFRVRDIRMKKVLCPQCKPYERGLQVDLSRMTKEQKIARYKKLRYGI